MVRSTEMFCEIICQYVLTRTPIDPELFLVGSVSHPPVLHVGGFGALGLQILGYETQGSGVVGHDWCGGLDVTHFFEEHSSWDGLS